MITSITVITTCATANSLLPTQTELCVNGNGETTQTPDEISVSYCLIAESLTDGIMVDNAEAVIQLALPPYG